MISAAAVPCRSATRTRCVLFDASPRRQRRRGATRAFGVDVSQFEGALDAETSYAAVYAGLGLAATSFAATFFVAPNFRGQLKEAEDWKEIYASLLKKETQSITPLQTAAKLSSPETTLLDVSLASKFAKSSAKGSVNIPLYQPIEKWDVPSIARRAAFTFFGIPGTERNPDWLQTVQSSIPHTQEVIVMCELGGTLEKKIGMNTGFQSRSLKAVHFLQEAGYKNVLHMKEGMSGWIREGLPLN